MIKALSPYWIEIPFVSPNTSLTCTDFTLQVFVWNGDKGTPPSTPSYEITKTNTTGSTDVSRINIANLVSDFVDFTQQEGTTTELIDGNNQNWVKYQTFYTTSNASDRVIPSNVNIDLMLRGYSYGMDGENAKTPANKILLSGNEFKVNRGGVFVLPIKIEETQEQVGVIVFNSFTYNSSTATSSNIDMFYTINGFSPTSVTVQESVQGADVWTNILTLPNSSPLVNVIINYAENQSKDVRIVFYDNFNLYVSNLINIGFI